MGFLVKLTPELLELSAAQLKTALPKLAQKGRAFIRTEAKDTFELTLKEGADASKLVQWKEMLNFHVQKFWHGLGNGFNLIFRRKQWSINYLKTELGNFTKHAKPIQNGLTALQKRTVKLKDLAKELDELKRVANPDEGLIASKTEELTKGLQKYEKGLNQVVKMGVDRGVLSQAQLDLITQNKGNVGALIEFPSSLIGRMDSTANSLKSEITKLGGKLDEVVIPKQADGPRQIEITD